MKLRNLRAALGLSALGCLTASLLPAPALAYLGGDESSIAADRDAFKGQLRSTPMQQYSRHEITLGASTMVQEYTTPSGKVFAVTWQGPFPPDLRQLFGSYFTQYQSALAAQPRPGMHRQVRVAQGDLVVESAGHLRSFYGRAYVPSLVPAGVNLADLH